MVALQAVLTPSMLTNAAPIPNAEKAGCITNVNATMDGLETDVNMVIVIFLGCTMDMKDNWLQYQLI